MSPWRHAESILDTHTRSSALISRYCRREYGIAESASALSAIIGAIGLWALSPKPETLSFYKTTTFAHNAPSVTGNKHPANDVNTDISDFLCLKRRYVN